MSLEGIGMESNHDLSETFNVDELGHILVACEQMSCGYTRIEIKTHCCNLNEVVPKLRKLLGVKEKI